VVGLAGVDAHGGVAQRSEDTGRSWSGTIGIPSYEASFRTFSTRVILDWPLTGSADRDARAVYGAIRKGTVFTAIDALAGPGLLDFRADGPWLTARVTLPRGGEVVLLRGGQEAARAAGELRYDTGQRPGAYRVEVRVPGAPGSPAIPWIVSNPIYVAIGPAPSAPLAPSASRSAIPPFPWRIEKDPSSSAILRTSEHSVEVQYKIGEGGRNSQFVALATDLHGETVSALDLSLAADRPTRISIQMRTGDGRRWGRSYYVDPAGTPLRANFLDLRPIGGAGSLDARSITSILLVIDLTNTPPGRAGTLRVLSSTLVR